MTSSQPLARPDPLRISRVLLIVNPGARRGGAGQAVAVRALEEAGVHCEVIRTNAPSHATEIARERGRAFDAVFTLGGDGTAMEVMTALAGAGPPVGILPGGTGNVLVRSFGIPLAIERAVPKLLDGTEALLDLGRLEDGRHFAIGVGVGLDEQMIAGASPTMKKRAGLVAYVLSAARALWRLDRFTIRLTVDGRLYERQAASVLVANIGEVLGGLIKFGADIAHDDGVLHACVYSPDNLWDALRLFWKMMRGTVHTDRCALCVSGTHFRIETEPPHRAQADGELLGLTPIEIRVEPHAARVLIPRPKSTGTGQVGGVERGRGAGRFVTALLVLWIATGTLAVLALDPVVRTSGVSTQPRMLIHAGVIALTLLLSRALVRRFFRARRAQAVPRAPTGGGEPR